jgi:hypothetical protein
MAAARQKEMKLSITVVAIKTATGPRLVCSSATGRLKVVLLPGFNCGK